MTDDAENKLVLGIAITALIAVGVFMFWLAYTTNKQLDKDIASAQEREKARIGRLIVDSRNGFIQVHQVTCRPASQMLTKRQESKLTEYELSQFKDSVHCGEVVQGVRLRKELIKGYIPLLSVRVVRDGKGLVQIEQFNMENCTLSMTSPNSDKIDSVTIWGSCGLLDDVLRTR
jgi:hypothetical protein